MQLDRSKLQLQRDPGRRTWPNGSPDHSEQKQSRWSTGLERHKSHRGQILRPLRTKWHDSQVCWASSPSFPSHTSFPLTVARSASRPCCGGSDSNLSLPQSSCATPSDRRLSPQREPVSTSCCRFRSRALNSSLAIWGKPVHRWGSSLPFKCCRRSSSSQPSLPCSTISVSCSSSSSSLPA